MRRVAVVVLVTVVAFAAIYVTRPAATAAQLTASGTVEADEVAVAAEAPGRLVELLVDEGAHVATNQVVGRLDDAQLQVQLKQADAAQRQVLETQLDHLTLRAPL